MKRWTTLKFKSLGRKVKQSTFLNKYFPNFKNKIYWSGDSHSWAKGAFIGSFFMMLPIPFQMIFSSVTAYYLKANIPLATALAWITNPFTMVPIWYFGYRFGTWILDTPTMESITGEFQPLSYEWFQVVFPLVWEPLYLGNMAIGFIIGFTLYTAISAFNTLFKFK